MKQTRLLLLTILTAIAFILCFTASATPDVVYGNMEILDTTEYGLLVSRNRTFTDSMLSCKSTQKAIQHGQKSSNDIHDSIVNNMINKSGKHVKWVDTHAERFMDK